MVNIAALALMLCVCIAGVAFAFAALGIAIAALVYYGNFCVDFVVSQDVDGTFLKSDTDSHESRWN